MRIYHGRFQVGLSYKSKGGKIKGVTKQTPDKYGIFVLPLPLPLYALTRIYKHKQWGYWFPPSREMASLLSTKPCIKYVDVFRCQAQVSSSPRTQKIGTPWTRLPKSSRILLADLQVNEVVERQSRCGLADDRKHKRVKPDGRLLEDAYERCRYLCAEYAKTFYLGWEPQYFFFLYVFLKWW